MIETGIKVEGLGRIMRDLQALGLDVDDLKDAMARIASIGARKAASYAPKRTGRLATTIRGNRAKNRAVVTAGRARVPYAGPINYGWPARNIKAAWFMQKADAAVRPMVIPLLEHEINKAIRKRNLS